MNIIMDSKSGSAEGVTGVLENISDSKVIDLVRRERQKHAENNVVVFTSPFTGRWLMHWAHGKCRMKTLQ